MEPEQRKLISPAAFLFDLGFAGLMFLFFFFVVIPPHVPVYDPTWKLFWTAYTSLVMAGFFFLGACLFHVTLADQLQRRKAAKS